MSPNILVTNQFVTKLTWLFLLQILNFKKKIKLIIPVAQNTRAFYWVCVFTPPRLNMQAMPLPRVHMGATECNTLPSWQLQLPHHLVTTPCRLSPQRPPWPHDPRPLRASSAFAPACHCSAPRTHITICI